MGALRRSVTIEPESGILDSARVPEAAPARRAARGGDDAGVPRRVDAPAAAARHDRHRVHRPRSAPSRRAPRSPTSSSPWRSARSTTRRRSTSTSATSSAHCSPPTARSARTTRGSGSAQTLRDCVRGFGIEPPTATHGGRDARGRHVHLGRQGVRFSNAQTDPTEMFRLIWANRGAPARPDGLLPDRRPGALPAGSHPTTGSPVRETIAECIAVPEVCSASELATLRACASPPRHAPTTTRSSLGGGSTLILDEYGKLKYEIRNRSRSKATQTAIATLAAAARLPVGARAFDGGRLRGTARPRCTARAPAESARPGRCGDDGSTHVSDRIRAYNVGFGDCFLLAFDYADGSRGTCSSTSARPAARQRRRRSMPDDRRRQIATDADCGGTLDMRRRHPPPRRPHLRLRDGKPGASSRG